MDTAAINAITALQLDDEYTRERWFELVCQTYDELAAADRLDWQQFASSITASVMSVGLSAPAVEQFIHTMVTNDPNPLETISCLREAADELPMIYKRLATVDTAEASYDEAAWNGFLAEHGVYWDGDEASWGEFRAWFLYQADQRSMGDPAQGFINYAETRSDKRSVFAEYSVPISEGTQPEPVDLSTHPEMQQGDTGEWVDYLDKMLTHNGF